ncbi:MAG: putative peptidoglycan-binding protein [Deltaproteobacteria bacterium]|nr:putative peptidoglycan-binding protein [Deltaproteobacteria bacterium]
MPSVLKKGSQGAEVSELQGLLVQRGYPVVTDGVFGNQTYKAVRAFQSQNLDQHGQPLKVDGEVGPLTWWSLTHPKPVIVTPSAIDYAKMPPFATGGSRLGKAALGVAIGELRAGAGEVGGNNCGPWVKKYLVPAGLGEGESWCASFVSWSYLQACEGDKRNMPFPYSPGARDLMSKLKKRGWTNEPQGGYEPRPGDLVFWWREKLSGWLGHVGLVHQLKDGMLYTIEGNRSPRVQGFSYIFSRMEKLLGYGHVPDE